MQLAFASVFGDHMVLQQQASVPVWGTATPGATVVVTFAGQRVSGKTDADGQWQVRLAPLQASDRPGVLEAVASNAGPAGGTDAKVCCQDVLVGEVWICSGQSNMEWSVAVSKDADQEIEAANYPLIRVLTVPHIATTAPEKHMPAAAWVVCSPKTAGPFTAVGYFFGRELHQRLGVPVGLVNSSWGGTVCEAWTSRQALLADPTVCHLIKAFEDSLPRLTELTKQWEQAAREIDARTKDTQNLGYPRGWAGAEEPADSQWRDVKLPGTWRNRGIGNNGIIWSRKVVDLPASWAGRDLELTIGATDKSDVTYFNNEKVGSLTIQDRTDAWCVIRTYPVPGRLVKAGRNVIAVRVHCDKYDAGMTGPAARMMITCPSVPGAQPIPLAGTWRYAVEADYGLVEVPAMPMGPGNPNAPTALFNGMIHPLLPMAVRGAIWYQGESNAARAKEYRTLFQTMIRDWRKQFGQENLAFHFVQLANYMGIADQPIPSAWAELREAQAMALALTNTGIAVAIDVGEEQDIHPRNKQDVGKRLAYSALHRTYGQKNVVPNGPHFQSAKREGRAMRITFDHATGLTCGGNALKGFAIKGANGEFVWADAKIDGDSVLVWNDQVPDPHAVRYAWADNPIANLYNAAGLPATPFRTDGD